MLSAMEIPEIVDQVNQYLDITDRLACIRVCKAWYHQFLPSIWEKIKPLPYSAHPLDNEPANVKRHAHLIREYSLRASIDADHPLLSMHQLLSVHLSPHILRTSSQETRDVQGQLLAMTIIQNPSLESVHIEEYSVTSFAPFLQAVLESSSLQSLYMEQALAYPSQMNESLFWKACSSLKVLEFDMKIPDSDIPSFGTDNQLREVAFNRIKGLSPLRQLRLLAQCPRLKRLSWRLVERQEYPTEELSSLLCSGRWPDLESLEVNGARLSQETLLQALALMPRGAAALSVSRSGFGPQAMVKLEQSLATIKTLELKLCDAVTSSMVQQILSSCPLLETFSADELSYIDMVDLGNDDGAFATPKNSWVCLGLKSFSVRITVWVPGMAYVRHDNEIVIQQLSRLSQIVSVDLSNKNRRLGPRPRDGKGEGLQFRTHGGLKLLSTWIQIRSLMFTDHQQMMGEELRWILKNWRKIRRIHGPLNTHDQWTQWASGWFRQSGISLLPYQ